MEILKRSFYRNLKAGIALILFLSSTAFTFAQEFKEAHFKGDHIKQGGFLEFPLCCREFFNEHWSKGYIDPIWQMVHPDKFVLIENNTLFYEVEDCHPFSNPLLRYAGIRVGFHIPCSFNCPETIQIAEQRLTLMKEDDKKLLIALLSMPMSWDCYHGTAIIKTPLFQIVMQSNPCTERFVVKVKGKFMPRETPEGTEFPYNLKGG